MRHRTLFLGILGILVGLCGFTTFASAASTTAMGNDDGKNTLFMGNDGVCDDETFAGSAVQQDKAVNDEVQRQFHVYTGSDDAASVGHMNSTTTHDDATETALMEVKPTTIIPVRGTASNNAGNFIHDENSTTTRQDGTFSSATCSGNMASTVESARVQTAMCFGHHDATTRFDDAHGFDAAACSSV